MTPTIPDHYSVISNLEQMEPCEEGFGRAHQRAGVEVLKETATVEVTYTHVVGYKIDSASACALHCSFLTVHNGKSAQAQPSL